MNDFYYGLLAPGLNPERFAPGLVNTTHHEHSAPTFTLDGTTCYWSRWWRPDDGQPQTIMEMKNVNGKWQEPTVASFSGTYNDGGPVISHDGKTLYFYSSRPYSRSDGPSHQNLWKMDNLDTHWSEPIKISSPPNTDQFQASPSVTLGGSLYFVTYDLHTPNNMAIARSKWELNQYSSSVILGTPFNSRYHDWLPYIAPDESFLIYASDNESGYGEYDLYLSKRTEDGKWREPQNLGPTINTHGSERFPGMTHDGKYFFFVRDSTIYWVSSAILLPLF